MSIEVTLIITTFNEEKSIASWCDSLIDQTLLPDEVVIVDSESEDKTVEIFRRRLEKANIPLKCIVRKCNISEGRNIAITNATFDNILITDAGVSLERSWVENMSKSLEQHNIVSGYYEFTGSVWFQKSFKRLFYKSVDNINKNTFLPSSRSLALRRECWEKVGGYNESFLIGEDTDFDIKLKEAAYSFFFQKNAIVKWELRSSLFKLIKQQYLYSYWDGVIFQNTGNSKLTLLSFFTLVSLFGVLYFPLFIFALPVLFVFVNKVKKYDELVSLPNYILDFIVLNLCYLSKGIGFLNGVIKRKLK